MSDDLVSGPLQTLLGEEVDVTLNPLKFNQAEAVETDILACNGVINIIDDLLIPPGKNWHSSHHPASITRRTRKTYKIRY